MKRQFTLALAAILVAVLAVSYAEARRKKGGGGGTTPQLSLAEQAGLISLREEEKLARDVYLALGEKWQDAVFTNIAQAEAKHMEAVRQLIVKYGLEDPVTDDTRGVFSNPEFGLLYHELVADGLESAMAAYKVGAMIEEMDIVDIQELLLDVEHADIADVYDNLMRGSRNHLRAFASLIAAGGETYEAQFLSQEDFDAIAESDIETGGGGGGRR